MNIHHPHSVINFITYLSIYPLCSLIVSVVIVFFPLFLLEDNCFNIVLSSTCIQWNIKITQSCLTLCDPMDTPVLCPWNSPGKNTGVG